MKKVLNFEKLKACGFEFDEERNTYVLWYDTDVLLEIVKSDKNFLNGSINVLPDICRDLKIDEEQTLINKIIEMTEKGCFKEPSYITTNSFTHEGSETRSDCEIIETFDSGFIFETNRNWVGYELDSEEILEHDIIQSNEKIYDIQVYEVVKVVCFTKENKMEELKNE